MRGVQPHALHGRVVTALRAGDGDQTQSHVEVSGTSVCERELLVRHRPILGFAEFFELRHRMGHDPGRVFVVTGLAQRGTDPQVRTRPIPGAEPFVRTPASPGAATLPSISEGQTP
jgi:hypothetical protein